MAMMFPWRKVASGFDSPYPLSVLRSTAFARPAPAGPSDTDAQRYTFFLKIRSGFWVK